MTDTSGSELSSAVCRPGSVLRIEEQLAVLCAFVRRGPNLFGVTVGHAFTNPSADVELMNSSSAFRIGVVEDWLADGAHDVGVFRVTQPQRCQMDPEDDFISVDPYPVSRLAEAVQSPCRIYFGHHQRDLGTINSATPEARMLITSPWLSIPGDSGSPSYVETAAGWSLVGQYLGLSQDTLSKRFQHPGPGLARLGFTFGG